MDLKRVREQKMLENMTRKIERYEGLMIELEKEVDAPTSRRIKREIAVCLPFCFSRPGKKERSAD